MITMHLFSFIFLFGGWRGVILLLAIASFWMGREQNERKSCGPMESLNTYPAVPDPKRTGLDAIST